jgi:hypothetical protein
MTVIKFIMWLYYHPGKFCSSNGTPSSFFRRFHVYVIELCVGFFLYPQLYIHLELPNVVCNLTLERYSIQHNWSAYSACDHFCFLHCRIGGIAKNTIKSLEPDAANIILS